MVKRSYLKPDFEVISLENSDVICTSGDTDISHPDDGIQ